MSQARVTDFFSQKKKAVGGPVKPATRRRKVVDDGSAAVSTRSIRSKSKDDFLCSSPVHEEFVRVIDEAVRLDDGGSVGNKNAPRTPKQTSSTELDLCSAVFSATADHSTAKKRRQLEPSGDAQVVVPDNITKNARKKLVLPQDSPQALSGKMAPQPKAPESTVSGLNAADHVNVETSNSPQEGQDGNSGQVDSKALSKEEISSLKSRLRWIRKRGEEMTGAALSASVLTLPSPATSAASAPSKRPAALVSDAKTLKKTLARTKELADSVQKGKEERESEERMQYNTKIQDSSELPAYQRYHTLAQASPPSLSLPYQYKVLAEMFRSLDTVVAMLYNRCETATFAKIKQGVQDMIHKRFEASHLAQIKTVFPEAYTFRQEKNIPTFNSSCKKSTYQLTVEPVILSDCNEVRPSLSASLLLERRHIFHQSILSIVKWHHKAFLAALVPPMSVPEDKLTRWHPRFNVDTVPVIQASSLPEPPHAEKLATAQDVLEKARTLITPKMERALLSLATNREDDITESKEPGPPETSTLPQTSAAWVPTSLKGVSMSLLDRIRAKEAQKLQAAMTRNPSHEDRLLMMSRLPELARILRNVFVGEKKAALIMEVACNRMMSSYRSAISSGEMEKHIHLLAEVAADWLTIHQIRKDFYLKLNKNMDLNIVVDKLRGRLKEEERI